MSKHKKKARTKSYLRKAIRHRDEHNIVIFIIQVIMGLVVDVLRFIKNFIIACILLFLPLGIIAGLVVYSKVKPIYDEYNSMATEMVDNSSIDTFKNEEATYIYDSNNVVIAKLRGDKNSEYIDYENINPYVVEAYVAVEDRTFWENPGIDIKGLIRVGVDFIRTKGAEMHGASTITQQLARNIFLTHEVSLERKAKEMLIALKLTKKYSKEDIMEFYVNDICYANAVYGIEAASQNYFNKPSSKLTLSEAAYLCAIPNSPEYYNPYKHPERAVSRRDKILKDMLEMGYITETEYNEALNETIALQKQDIQFNSDQSTFAVDCATRYLMKQDGFEFKYSFKDHDSYTEYKNSYQKAYDDAYYKLITGGYKVYTTLDTKVQTEMQDILNEKLSFSESVNDADGSYELQGAITVIDNESGRVIAVVGGRKNENTDTDNYNLNRAFQSYRQPGSSIKPLVVYTPALMYGYTPNSLVQNISISAAKTKGVDVQSLTGEIMTLRSALERSKNGVAWQLFDQMGGDWCITPLTRMKFSNITCDDYYDSASLGGFTYGVTTVEMAGAYSTLENHGYFREPTCIDGIFDKNGVNIYTTEQERQIYTEKDSDTVVDMMTGVIKRGTAAKLGWYKSTNTVAAAKTGTTNDSKDGWLCGFTPYYTVAVWVGYDMPKTLNNLYGATYPGQIWKDCMLSLISDKEEITSFEKSDDYYDLDYSYNMALPAYIYDRYMPERSDDEVLGGDYTVFDYRLDCYRSERLDPILNKFYSLDRNDPNFAQNAMNIRYEADAVIALISSSSKKAEMQARLDSTYNSIMGSPSNEPEE